MLFVNELAFHACYATKQAFYVFHTFICTCKQTDTCRQKCILEFIGRNWNWEIGIVQSSDKNAGQFLLGTRLQELVSSKGGEGIISK